MKSKNEKRWHPFRSKPERTCSEAELPALVAELADELMPGDRLILDGQMGAGKSTFVKHLLAALAPGIESQGSPTFALNWSYDLGTRARIPRLDHVDLYRLKNEDELENSGLLDLLWDGKTVVAVEWLSLFPEIEASLRKRMAWLKIDISAVGEDQRLYRFTV